MAEPVQRNIVISAVNLRKGGTLTVLRDCLQYLSGHPEFNVTALVHQKDLCSYPGINYIEIPWSTDNWLKRLWCEYVTMNRISKSLEETDLWLSLHDTTPRVKARRQAVYCHTPFPFMSMRLSDWKLDYKIALFSLFTRFAYSINVHRNRFLIVQQNWMRKRMSSLLRYNVENIIVAPPSFRPLPIPDVTPCPEPVSFLYPATADVHKDFETLCRAAAILEQRIGKGKFKVILTISGEENKYARFLKAGWGNVASIDFHGLMSREELASAMSRAHCLVFTSRAETWGLPISEFRPTGKPMILPDLPYAYETAAGAPMAAFFPVSHPEALADIMQGLTIGSTSAFSPVPANTFQQPYARDWASLFELLLK